MNNIGDADRIVRYIIGIALIVVGIVLQLTTGRFWWLSLVGSVSVITATIRTCPLYLPFGINTNRKTKVATG